MPRRYEQWGDGIPMQELPVPVIRQYRDFAAGYVSADAPEHTAPGALVYMLDGEVNRGDRLVRAPGIVTRETFPYTPRRSQVHADLNGRSELLIFAPPYLGVKQYGATTWYNVGLAKGNRFEATNYAGIFLASNAVGSLWSRTAGQVGMTAVAAAQPARTLSVFAGRVQLGGTYIATAFEPMGRRWSDSSGDPILGWDETITPGGGAAGFEILVSNSLTTDFCVADRALGYDVLAILCRRSIWVGVPTNDSDRPLDFRPRIEGLGCVSGATAFSTQRGVIFLSDAGVMIFDGNGVQPLSEQINHELLPLPDSAEDWTATWNPGSSRYYLHAANGTWMLDMQRGRWARWSLICDHGVVFPDQFSAPSWDALSGSWDDLVGSWDTLGSATEKGLPTYFVKGFNLGREDVAVETQFGLSITPTFELGLATDSLLTAQFTASRVQMIHEAAGTVAIDMPDAEGTFEEATVGTVTGKTTNIPVIHTGRGIGCRLRITSGNPKIREVALVAHPAGDVLVEG